MLRDAGIPVEEHAAHFAHDAPDDQWLASVGARGWYVISHNRRIRYTPNERDAVFRARVGVFFAIGKGPFVTLATNFVNTIRRVERFIEAHPRPLWARHHPALGVPAETGTRLTICLPLRPTRPAVQVSRFAKA